MPILDCRAVVLSQRWKAQWGPLKRTKKAFSFPIELLSKDNDNQETERFLTY